MVVRSSQFLNACPIFDPIRTETKVLSLLTTTELSNRRMIPVLWLDSSLGGVGRHNLIPQERMSHRWGWADGLSPEAWQFVRACLVHDQKESLTDPKDHAHGLTAARRPTTWAVMVIILFAASCEILLAPMLTLPAMMFNLCTLLPVQVTGTAFQIEGGTS